MANYTITFARSARKELESLPASLIRRIVPRIDGLAKNPRPAGCRKIKGGLDLWRIRIGDYRVVFRSMMKLGLLMSFVSATTAMHMSDAMK